METAWFRRRTHRMARHTPLIGGGAYSHLGCRFDCHRGHRGKPYGSPAAPGRRSGAPARRREAAAAVAGPGAPGSRPASRGGNVRPARHPVGAIVRDADAPFGASASLFRAPHPPPTERSTEDARVPPTRCGSAAATLPSTPSIRLEGRPRITRGNASNPPNPRPLTAPRSAPERALKTHVQLTQRLRRTRFEAC
jgi:hypothetical protein